MRISHALHLEWTVAGWATLRSSLTSQRGLDPLLLWYVMKSTFTFKGYLDLGLVIINDGSIRVCSLMDILLFFFPNLIKDGSELEENNQKYYDESYFY